MDMSGSERANLGGHLRLRWACQALMGPTWVGSYSVGWGVWLLKGHLGRGSFSVNGQIRVIKGYHGRDPIL